MSLTIKYLKTKYKKSSNIVLFSDDKFNTTKFKKYLTTNEFSYVNDLLKSSYSKRLKLNDTTYKVAYVNSKLYRSDLGHQLLKKHTDCDFSAVYFYSGMFDKTQFSLRSLDDGADVSKIAESFKTGGGGHKCAAGMSLKGSHIKL